MKARHLGISIIAISLIILVILFWFNFKLNEQNIQACNSLCGEQEGASCSIEACPFNQQGHNNSGTFVFVIGLLVAFLGGIGFYLSLIKDEKLIEQKKYDLTGLTKEEKNVFSMIKNDRNGGIYQSKIIEQFNFPKAKVTRILDKLEQRQLIERKRRGMTNIIVVK